MSRRLPLFPSTDFLQVFKLWDTIRFDLFLYINEKTLHRQCCILYTIKRPLLQMDTNIGVHRAIVKYGLVIKIIYLFKIYIQYVLFW